MAPIFRAHRRAYLDAMTPDDDFKPRLGKVRSLGGKKGRRYLQRVLHAVALAGSRGRFGQARRAQFHGNRIGRGSGVGRVLASRDRYAAYRQRRVIIKSRIVKLAGKGMKAAQAHLRYIQRDGVTRDGQPGALYDADRDRTDGKAFLERAEGDRHQFRFIVSAEDGAQYDDLKPFVRRLMRTMEEDLGTKLEWVAVDHHNTGHPHTHIVVRGRDDRGTDLIIAREYLTIGMRERAAEIVAFDLGPRSDFEIENRLRSEVEQERFTSLDRRLIQEADSERLISAGHREAFQQSLRAGRLQKLGRLGLAQETVPGVWRLSAELEPVLRRMGERGDIIKTMHREMAEKGIARAPSDYVIYDPAAAEARPIIGKIIARGLSDEHADRHFVIVDGIDGYSHYVDIGKGEATDPIPDGRIVEVTPKLIEARAVDRTVAEIAALHDGRYSIDIHLQHDPSARHVFAETHVRRLEAMRRLAGIVEREPDGSWIIASDHVERAASFERMQGQAAPVTIRTLSALGLDRELVSTAPASLRDSGFGREVREALVQRRQWLVARSFAQENQDQVIYRSDMLIELRRRELSRVAGQLSGELGLNYVETRSGDRVEGLYRRHIDLASGRFAVIEKTREFTLGPWRPALERGLGKQVSGFARGETISWSWGRQRSGPNIG